MANRKTVPSRGQFFLGLMTVPVFLMIILVILVTGFSGLIAQVLLLRQLLISYFGNELTLGIILSSWLISEALGVFISGKLADRVRNKIALFSGLQIVFSLALPVCLYLAHIFKSAAGIYPGEAVGLALIFCSSFVIILPVAFAHAGIFSCGCKILSSLRNETAEQAAGSIAKIYAVEIIGAIIGGFALTYYLLSCFNTFQIAFLASLASLLVNIPFLKAPPQKPLRYLILSLSGVFIYLLFSGSSAYIQNSAMGWQFGSSKVLDHRNSIYGNISVIEKDKQQTFFYNGIPTITSPLPDITFSEEFGNLPLLFHADPKNILIIGGGVGGLLYELLKHPVKKIDYLELDPLLITMFKKYSATTAQKELADKRVNIIHADGRMFLRQTGNKYDVILIGLSNPRDLSSNRLFTSEFFYLAGKRLNPGGILSFCLTGSLAYLSQELKNLNACILGAAKQSFRAVCVLPGDYNMFFASDSAAIMDINAAEISSRIVRLDIKTNLLVPGYIEYRMDSRWRDWFFRSMAGATKKINQDTRPFAVFTALILWNKQFSAVITKILNYLAGLNLELCLVVVLMIGLLFFSIAFLRRKRSPTLPVTYCIATTGFFGMLMSLIIIFLFQVRYGYIYREIGILTSLFMAGSAIGSLSILGIINSKGIGAILNLLIKAEIAITGFTLVMASLANWLCHASLSYIILLALSLISGAFVGLEFGLAGKIYILEKKAVGETSGILYFADLVGGCIAGILGGVVLLPVIGLIRTCLVLAALKSSSLTAIGIAKLLQKNPQKT